jgi:hypothetical protein
MIASWRTRTVVILLILSGTLANANAQSASSLLLTNEVQARTLLYDNFFEAPNGMPQRDVHALRVDWVGSTEAVGPNRWRLYGRADVIVYEEFGASPGFAAGIRRYAGRHMLDVSGGSEWGRPTVDVGDSFAEVRALTTEADYAFRVVRPWELLGLFQYRRYDVADNPERDARDYLLGAGVRYRDFGPTFVPSVTMATGSRDSRDPNQDFGQVEMIGQVQSTLEQVRLRVRYRNRFRSYDETGLGSNAGREDRRHRWTADLQFPFHRHLSAIVGYQIERSRSTRLDRSFTSQLLHGGVTVRLDPARPRTGAAAP